MVDLKLLLSQTNNKLTSPTAFSWYGVAGVVATGVLTFLSTKKWIDWRSANRYKYFEQAKTESNPYCTYPDKRKDFRLVHAEKLKNRPLKEKAKEVAGTAMIFVPPFTIAALTCYSIIHGNRKALESIGILMDSNNALSARLDKYKSFAAGAMASEVKNHTEDEPRVSKDPHYLYFSDDDLQHEDYGEPVRFYLERTGQEFTSTPLEVLLAEYEFNKLVWGTRCGDFGSLNELLDFFQLQGVDDGNYCGWSKEAGFDNGYDWIGFAHKRVNFDDGAEGYMICFDSEPTYDEFYHKLMYGS